MRKMTGALLAAGLSLAISAATAMPAGAAAATPAAAGISGSETVNGILVTSGVSGTRTTISSVIVAKGVFGGVGRIVEIPREPGDPANVNRYDLVYPVGTMHLVSTTVGASFTLNPHNCQFKGALQESSEVTGGIGLFVDASGVFTGSVSPQGLFPRNPDGSCAADRPSLHEVDKIEFSGTLSF